MTSGTGTWVPKTELTLAAIRRYAALMASADRDDIGTVMTAGDRVNDAGLMRLPADAWQLAEALDDAEIDCLIRFFTLAEMQLDGWKGGKQSPVIPLVRILKQRGKFSDTLRKWIKTHTDNRFLPYGSAL